MKRNDHNPELVGTEATAIALLATLTCSGLDRFVGDLALRPDEVRLRHAVARVRDALGELAVRRQEEEALRLLVEPPDAEDPPLPGVRDQVDRARPRLANLVRADDARRLVEQVVAPLARVRTQLHAVDVDDLGLGIDLEPELGHDLAVDGDLAALDQLVRSAP